MVVTGELVVVDSLNLCISFGFGETLLEDPLPPVFLFLAAMFDLTLGAEFGLLVVAKNGLGLAELENGLELGEFDDGLGVADELENGI